MPGPRAEGWGAVLDLLDKYLAEPSRSWSADELKEARAILEVELERDAAVFGDVPGALADAISEHQAALAVRAIQLEPPQWKRDAQLKFEWPLEPVRVTSLFGQRFHPIDGRLKAHEGVDLAAETGQLISAAGPGVVRRAGWNGNYGYQVEVQHGGGVVTRYSHLLQPLVEPGDTVDTGDPLGLAGSTGYSTGPHLHFEVWRRGRAQDPLHLMRFIAGVSPASSTLRRGRGHPSRHAHVALKDGVAQRDPLEKTR
jgi:murein DD-endopeptidase MepM/ murein hydrolase activator NlpD